MRQLPDFGDERQTAWCIYCGSTGKGTRDHLQSKVFLDEPSPENLASVRVCGRCNTGFSKDEQFVACLVECERAGGRTPEAIARSKVRRISADTPRLARQIADAISTGPEATAKRRAAYERVGNVVVKLARGHALYELNVPCLGEPSRVVVGPLLELCGDVRGQFETPRLPRLWPEVGSRAMQWLLIAEPAPVISWVEIQPGQYRFMALQEPVGVLVRLVIGEYLAAEVRWVDT